MPAIVQRIEHDIRALEHVIAQPQDEVHRLRAHREQIRRQLAEAQDPNETERLRKEWQGINARLREIEAAAASPDPQWYEQLLNGGDKVRERWSDLIRQDIPLDRRLQTLRELRTLLTQLLDQVQRIPHNADDRIQAILSLTPDDEQLRQELARLADTRFDAQNQLADLEHRQRDGEQQQAATIAEIIKRFPELQPHQNAPAELLRILTRLLGMRHDEVACHEPVRHVWEPILQDWVGMLGNSNQQANDQQSLINAYIRHCHVIGITCTEKRFTLEGYGHHRFDVAIVDEVSKATAPEILMPLLLARKSVLVGDHRQLPPLFREHEGSYAESVEDLQEQSENGEIEVDGETLRLFSRENFDRFRRLVTASWFKEQFDQAPDSLKVTPTTQYRMHPEIMAVINRFYDNLLTCGLPDPDGTDPNSDVRLRRIHGLSLQGAGGAHYVKPDNHVIWIDSSLEPGNQRPHFETTEGTSRANILEAAVIATCLRDLELALRQQGYGAEGKPPKRVGVITFYGRQVQVLRDAINKMQSMYRLQFQALKYDLNTVDRYQGRERPIVIVSLVRAPRRPLSERAVTAQFERINVAFSRAQELLIITGCVNAFRDYQVLLPSLVDRKESDRRGAVYRQIIEYVANRGGYWKARDIVDRPMWRDFSAA